MSLIITLYIGQLTSLIWLDHLAEVMIYKNLNTLNIIDKLDHNPLINLRQWFIPLGQTLLNKVKQIKEDNMVFNPFYFINNLM